MSGSPSLAGTRARVPAWAAAAMLIVTLIAVIGLVAAATEPDHVGGTTPAPSLLAP